MYNKNRVFLFLIILTQIVFAQHLIEKSISATVDQSDLILRARVISSNTRWNNDNRGKHIYTLANFEVLEIVKGYYPGSRINLDIIGGTIGDTTEYVSNSFSFHDKDEMILMLSSKLDLQQYQIKEKINITDDRIYLNTKYVLAESFVSFLKNSILKNTPIPQNIDELEKRVDSFELKTDLLDKKYLKNNSQQRINSADLLVNLAPYQPSGWSAPIVVSTVQGNNSDAGEFKETDKLYIDWSAANFGPDNISSPFLFSLFVDDVLYAQWGTDGLSGGYYVYVSDFQIEPLGFGTHTIKIKIDPTNAIPETNETDNEYIKTITVQAVAGLPIITNISPSSASAGTGSVITINGNNFGTTRGNSKVEFFYKYGEPKIESTRYVFWSNTRIDCEVPIGIINDYPASASSGPVSVSTDFATSIGYNYNITFGYGDVKWDTNPALVPLRINSNTTDFNNAGDEIITAAGTWTSAGARFGFYYDGSTNLTNATSDGKNEIMWGTTEGSLATAYYWFVDNSMIEADIVFDDSWNWSKDGSSIDVQSIALHELGHWLSLRDIYGAADESKVMFGFASSGTLKRSLTSSEETGIKWIYGTGSVSLAAPLLDSPPNSAADSPISQLLKWNKALGKNVVYRIQVSLDQNFTNPIIDESNLTVTQYQLSNLSYNKTYYWRVNASNTANGVSNWSDIWSFITVKQYFTITCISNPAQGGSTNGSGTFADGTLVSVTAVPAYGYNFVNWTDANNIVSTNLTYSFSIMSSRTLTANFDLIPIITLVQPNGGEVWQAGTQHDIRWTSANVSAVKIEYSTNNGSNWNTITNSTPAQRGYFNWTVHNAPSAQVKIRISSTSDININDVSENVFTISPIPFITVISPNGSEKWHRKSQHEIRWVSTVIQDVMIEYSSNNGSNWQIIINSIPAAGSTYMWTLPDIQTNQAKIRITDIANNQLSDQSNNTFTIESQPQLSLLVPDGGEAWLAGMEYQIKWTGENVSSIKLEYTLDSGIDWTTIINSTPAQPGNYVWLIPNISSTQAKIKISDADNLLTDTSENIFNIVGAPRGDVDGSGQLSSDDGILILRNTVGLQELTTRQQFSADCNKDGFVQAYDAFFILFYLFFGVWPR